MSSLISVIIPSYNTGDYIAEAVLSVHNDMEDAQIIVVDDASTDNTASILRKLDIETLKLVQLDKNSPGGAGYPSNIGLEHAQGEYIAFADSDDFFRRGYLSSMLKKLRATGTDICVANYTLIDTITHKELPAYGAIRWNNILAGKTHGLLKKEDYFNLSPEPWRKVYKRRIFSDPDIRFPVNGWFNEDYPFHWLTGLSASGGISFVNNSQYYHRVRRAGQTTSHFDRRIFCVFDHTRMILDFMDKHPDYRRYRWCLLKWLVLGLWKTRFLDDDLDDYYEQMRVLITGFDDTDVSMFRSGSLREERAIYQSLLNNKTAAGFCRELDWKTGYVRS